MPKSVLGAMQNMMNKTYFGFKPNVRMRTIENWKIIQETVYSTMETQKKVFQKGLGHCYAI